MSVPLFDSMFAVEELIALAPHLLLCLDFDGTLAPFEEDPAQVYLTPQMQRILQSLASQEGVTLAVISGRERTDLQGRVGIPDIIYAGNHGLEISGPGLLFIEPTALAYREHLQEVAAGLAARLKTTFGAVVEDKGLTVSVHYRKVAAAAQEEVRRLVHGAMERTSHPFVLTAGEKVFEIRPRVSWNKGAAVRWIKEQLPERRVLPIYLGDDATDEDAFNVLPEGITVKVGTAAETAAHYHIEDPAEVRRFLEWIDGRLHQRPLDLAVTKGP